MIFLAICITKKRIISTEARAYASNFRTSKRSTKSNI